LKFSPENGMRANRLLIASEIIVFGFFFLNALARPGEGSDLGGRTAIGAFEFFGVGASLFLLSKGSDGNSSLLDWAGCALALLVAGLGFAGGSITLFALYLFLRGRNDLNTKAAGTVAVAVAVQAVWAPLIFAIISLPLLQIDAAVVGWLESLLCRVPPGPGRWSTLLADTM
jgi:hypothetical protein